jgi:hypothetical protein
LISFGTPTSILDLPSRPLRAAYEHHRKSE